MPSHLTPLQRCNGALRSFGVPFRLREHRRSQWVTVYEVLPDRRTRERSLPGIPVSDGAALEQLCERLLSMARQGLPLESLVAERTEAGVGLRNGGKEPCWPRSVRRWWRFSGARG
jgi:hypothetical protein